MKKTVFLFLLLPTITVCYSQYTAVPDPNFEEFLETNGMGDGVANNGLVLTANIENVTVLDLESQIGVFDLTGIEDFAALEWFDFSSNLVETVDLSQNTFLKTLGCINNRLTALNLSNNSELEWLSCQGNQMTYLQLNSQYLEVIECFENYLTALDISTAEALTELYCDENQISELDISQNTLLQKLTCAANNITSLNTSYNPELFYLLCGYNNIESLDLSQNQSLTLLLAGFIPPLTYLDMRNGNNTNIGSFNVFGTDNLQCIFVDDASATYLDDWYKDPFTTFVNNDAECDALSVSSYEEDRLLIYPNPSKSTLTVSFSKPAEYIITDLNGKNLKTGNLNLGLSRITIDDLSAGLYFFKVNTDLGSITKKLVKK